VVAAHRWNTWSLSALYDSPVIFALADQALCVDLGGCDEHDADWFAAVMRGFWWIARFPWLTLLLSRASPTCTFRQLRQPVAPYHAHRHAAWKLACERQHYPDACQRRQTRAQRVQDAHVWMLDLEVLDQEPPEETHEHGQTPPNTPEVRGESEHG
jgi:hypothetical protein